ASDANFDLAEMPGQENTRQSIWPAMYPRLLELVEQHSSTLILVNNRRAAERIALRLNELVSHREEGATPVREIARAHHGSLAREERLLIEDQLKAVELPCLVAIASASEDPVALDDAFELVTRTYTYEELSRHQFENVLDMLDGRYPSEQFGELRARIVWDRIGGTFRARKGAKQLAIANAGT